MSDPFAGLPRGHFGAILADPPWRFRTWNECNGVAGARFKSTNGRMRHYSAMEVDEIAVVAGAGIGGRRLHVCFCGLSWPMLVAALDVLTAWGFQYKTCAFAWMKAHTGQIEMFRDDVDALMGMGYWTRANSEPCLLATRGKPKRLNADVRQGIIAPRREHSRKPDEVHGRIERLVAGPYLELFARQERPGWTCWGNETTKFNGRRRHRRPSNCRGTRCGPSRSTGPSW